MRGLPRGVRIISSAAVLALAIAACGGDDDTKTPAASGAASAPSNAGATGAVRIVGTEPQNPLVQTNTTEVGGGNVLDAIFTGLINYATEDAKPINAVAESITPSDENKKFTIKLKQGWKFHDGTEVKAKNFVDAWNYGAYGENAQSNSYFFEPIAGYKDLQGEDKDGDGKLEVKPKAKEMSGLKVIDDYTFEVTLEAPGASFPIRLGYTAFMPLPDSFAADPKAFGEKPIGNGPFKFVKWDKKQQIVLQADDAYIGPDKAKVKDVTFKVYQDQNAAYADLLGDSVDLMDTLPTAALAGEKYKTDLGDRVIEQAQGVIQTITFPVYKKEFQNADLRKAISKAIDRDLIIKNIFNGQRIKATGWVSPVAAGYKEGACGDACVFDPAAAKALLDKAGGFSGTLSLGYNADGDHKPWITAACNSIKNALGIACEPKAYVDFATYLKDRSEAKMVGPYRTGWQMDYPASENFLVPLYATGASSNDGKYSNKKFDELVEQAAAQEGDESYATYQQAEALLAEDMGIIPLWYGKTVAGHSKKVDNVVYTPFGTPDLSQVTAK
jgi:oligopeptide transport system substrate-binding protein